MELIQQALRFYHLMVLWLVRFVGGFRLPLPAPAPKDWASMPEHFVDDAMEVLLMASRMHSALDGMNLVRGRRGGVGRGGCGEGGNKEILNGAGAWGEDGVRVEGRGKGEQRMEGGGCGSSAVDARREV